MTQIYEGNKLVTVTLVKVVDNVIAKVDEDRVYIGMDKNEKAGKQKKGIFKELGYVPKYITTFSVDHDKDYTVGDKIELDELEGKVLTIRGISKGKGFAGGVKRWGWRGGPATHGYSRERHQGSIGTQRPAKVWKGKHMAGHMGAKKVTIKNLRVVKTDGNVIAVKGSIPGSRNSIIEISFKD